MGKSDGGGEEGVASHSRPQKTRGRRHLTCALHLPRRAKNWSQAGKPAETITHHRSIHHTLLHSECNPPFLSTTRPIIANRRDKEPGSMKNNRGRKNRIARAHAFPQHPLNAELMPVHKCPCPLNSFIGIF
jgi:hypothetical protein